MDKTMTVSLIIGSLRDASINRKFAEFIVAQLPEPVKVEEVNIADLPLYNQEYDEQDIASYTRVRKQLKNADAVLIVTPEYNRTMPAALKNVIDVASRPYNDSVWTAKKVAVVTASPGAYGGRASGLDVRKSMQMLSAQMMISPEVYLSRASDSLDDEGKVVPKTQEFLKKFVSEFIKFIGE